MRNFQDTLETRKQWFISAFSICMTVTLYKKGEKERKKKKREKEIKLTSKNQIKK